MGITEIITADPTNLEHILKTNFANYPKGPDYRQNFLDLLGHGIFNSDGETWKTQRKTAAQEFTARSLRELTVKSGQWESANRLLPTLQKALDEAVPIDMQNVFLRYTFDNICRIGFGVDPGCLEPGLPDVRFARAFDAGTRATLVRNMLPRPVWKLNKWLKLGPERRLAESIQVINEFCDAIVARRKAQLKALKEETSEILPDMQQNIGELRDAANDDGHSDILSRFIMLQGSGGEQYSDLYLRDVCTSFILAGRDTSGVAMSWFFWLLASHPEVEKKILEELHKILKARETSGVSVDEPRTFTFDELRSMTYLHAALTETLRLYPSVPADSKYAVKNDVLPDGTFVAKGWRVTYLIFAMGRLERIWGLDAAEFKPERWLGSDGTFRAESPFKYPAFNAGPRLCLGRDMAYITMKSVTATILRHYKLRLVPGHVGDYQMSLTLFMKYGLLMTVHPRKE